MELTLPAVGNEYANLVDVARLDFAQKSALLELYIDMGEIETDIKVIEDAYKKKISEINWKAQYKSFALKE